MPSTPKPICFPLSLIAAALLAACSTTSPPPTARGDIAALEPPAKPAPVTSHAQAAAAASQVALEAYAADAVAGSSSKRMAMPSMTYAMAPPPPAYQPPVEDRENYEAPEQSAVHTVVEQPVSTFRG